MSRSDELLDGIDTSDLPDSMRDIVELFPFISDASSNPRVTAIMGCAYLEEYLQEAIALNLPGLNSDLRKRIFTDNGPLSTVAAKIDVARAMEIIGPTTHTNCVQIARIRNRFAHNFKNHSFEDGDIPKLTNRFQEPPPWTFKGKSTPEKFSIALIAAMVGIANYLSAIRSRARRA